MFTNALGMRGEPLKFVIQEKGIGDVVCVITWMVMLQFYAPISSVYVLSLSSQRILQQRFPNLPNADDTQTTRAQTFSLHSSPWRFLSFTFGNLPFISCKINLFMFNIWLFRSMSNEEYTMLLWVSAFLWFVGMDGWKCLHHIDYMNTQHLGLL